MGGVEARSASGALYMTHGARARPPVRGAQENDCQAMSALAWNEHEEVRGARAQRKRSLGS
jgi:hypothetical protein